MRPIPTAFHIGPLELHTYGLGLAVAFYIAWRYLVARTRARGYPTEWMGALGIWVIVSALVGARLLHVLTNLSTYSGHPFQVLAVWHGGLASFGGLLFAVPTALWVTHRRCPEVGVLEGLDIAVPALAAGWAIGRVLGPQLMVAGGGHPTHQWFGMYYAGQVGKRLPVPVFQALEDFAVYLVLIAIERRLNRWPDGSRRVGYPPGIVLGVAMILWGIERSLDEHLWLGEDGRLGSDLVQLAGILLVAGGIVVLVRTRARWLNWLRTHHAGGPPATRAAQGDGAAAVDALEDAEHRT